MHYFSSQTCNVCVKKEKYINIQKVKKVNAKSKKNQRTKNTATFFGGGVKCTPHRCIKTKGQYNPKIHQGQLPNHQSHKHHNKPRISRFFNYIANLSIRERIPQAPFKKLVEIVEETFFQHKPMILMFLGIYSSPKWLS